MVGGAVSGVGGSPLPEAAVFWSRRTGFIDLGLVDGVPGNAWEINDAGQIRGAAVGPTAIFRWSQATGMQVLPAPGGSVILGTDMNARGQIVGRYGLGRTFLRTPGVEFIDLGGAGGNAEAINDKETIAGTIAGINRAGVWTRDTGFVDIGAPGSGTSSAFDVNNRGQVVGFSQVAGGFDQRAFLWTRDDGMINLNTRLGNAPPGLLLSVAQRINDKGAILAHDTVGAMYLLVPGAGAHEAPVIAPLKIGGTARVGGALSFSAAFTDVDLRDTHKAVWSWGDGSQDAGRVGGKPGAATVSGRHTYRSAGIYTVVLTLTDSGAMSTSLTRQVVVSGPGAWIKGEGTFHSPAGAVKAALATTGAARFAFMVDADTKAPNRTTPTLLAFSAGMLELRSSGVEAVAVPKAQLHLRGHGTVNGEPGYRFELRMMFASSPGTGKDRIWMRIWHLDPRTRTVMIDYENTVTPDTGDGSLVGVDALGREDT